MQQKPDGLDLTLSWGSLPCAIPALLGGLLLSATTTS